MLLQQSPTNEVPPVDPDLAGLVKPSRAERFPNVAHMEPTESGLNLLRSGKEKVGDSTTHKSGHRVYEQSWQRAAAILVAAGMSGKQIAESLDKCASSVSALMAVPWFQANVTKIIESKVGAADVLALCREKAIQAHDVLFEILHDKDAGARTRLQAATTVLDRVYGKPVSHVQSDVTVRSGDPVEEIARLEREKADMQMRLGDVAG